MNISYFITFVQRNNTSQSSYFKRNSEAFNSHLKADLLVQILPLVTYVHACSSLPQ